MFYSHEILSSRQYGVATIWLVATVGKGSQKKLTKKAIQGVNVPKACEKILDPGAPLALRLQGNLLYGVSRVFAQQCGYVLTDAEKTQSDMMTFLHIMQTSEIVPGAGKTRRQNIVLEDDPGFDPMSALPNPDLLLWDKDQMMPHTQGSIGDFSFLTPLGSSRLNSLSSCNNSALARLEIPSSSHSALSCRLPSDFGHQSPLFTKTVARDGENMLGLEPFAEEGFDPVSSMGFEFDGDGNLVEIPHHGAELDLPPLPGLEAESLIERPRRLEAAEDQRKENAAGGLLLDEDAYLINLGEPQLLDAVAFPTRMADQESASQRDALESGPQASAKTARALRNKGRTFLDTQVTVSRSTLHGWGQNYVDNMDSIRRRSTKSTARARKNAMQFLHGSGIAQVGAYRSASGFIHPLALDFAGQSLQMRLLGQDPGTAESQAPAKRGRRRKSEEAFGFHEDAEKARPSRRTRIDDEAELGRGDIAMMERQIMLDDSIPEMGMEAAPPMEDRHSSSVMPWSRQGSVVPGSSVRGSAQKPRTAPSPLFGKGSVVGSIDRYSDVNEALGDFGSHDTPLRIGDWANLGNIVEKDTQATGALNAASQEFLEFATQIAVDKGRLMKSDKRGRRWVEFEELANPHEHTRDVAANAFLHVLSLATKDAVSVDQDGTEEMVPFGVIRIGVDVPQGVESEDELA